MPTDFRIEGLWHFVVTDPFIGSRVVHVKTMVAKRDFNHAGRCRELGEVHMTAITWLLRLQLKCPHQPRNIVRSDNMHPVSFIGVKFRDY